MAEKTAKGKAKVKRVLRSLRHEEPDRIPLFEYYWTGFVRRWRDELGLASDADPYKYYDIDVLNVGPNMDPHIRPFQIVKQDESETVLRTGFGAYVRKVHAFPMPQYADFETDTIEKVQSFTFEDPWDERRFFSGGDDHVNCVGDDVIVRDIPSFLERVSDLTTDFCLFGSVLEATEFMVRSIGQLNMLLWIGLYPDEIGRFAQRINAWSLELSEAQLEAADGMLDGMLIAGDVAYAGNLFFSPDYWRKYFEPGLKAIVDAVHARGMPVLYHGCGNVGQILEDYIEVGIDGYHPLEAKAGLDVIHLRRELGHGLAFIGNNDVRLWAEADREKLEPYTLRKLNAGKGGGYFFGSDHSVPSDVSGATYDWLVNLVRACGNYPLELGEHDIPDLT
jgi:hypothetical protein